jgi:hypothetical protein
VNAFHDVAGVPRLSVTFTTELAPTFKVISRSLELTFFPVRASFRPAPEVTLFWIEHDPR